MLNPASRYPAPVQSTSSMVITNQEEADELQHSQADMKEPQKPYFQEHAAQAPESRFVTHNAQDYFKPLAQLGIKKSTAKKAVGLAVAAGGLFYLNKRLETNQADKARDLLIDKIKSATAKDYKSSAADKTNTLLTWLLGVSGLGLVTHVGFESAKIAKRADPHAVIENALVP